MKDPDEPILLARFNPIDASLAKNILYSEGIEARSSYNNSGFVNMLATVSRPTVSLYIRIGDAERALEVLGLAAKLKKKAKWAICPYCSSNDVKSLEDGLFLRIFVVLFLFIPLFFISKWKCRSCFRVWR